MGAKLSVKLVKFAEKLKLKSALNIQKQWTEMINLWKASSDDHCAKIITN